ncbi:hypothetical protein B0H14DRAFT_2767192, partial [Mycena olivaceomarginata]
MSFSMVSFGDLRLKIVQILYYSPRASEDYQDALTELVSLHHELVLISDIIQPDIASGPGGLIRHNVAEEVRRCRAEMQRFLDKTKGVWWAASEQRELRVLRDAVARRRAALSVLIGSSNLLISTATRDEVRARRETIQELTTTLKPVPHHGLISRSSPAGMVLKPGMTLEMSMLLRERANFFKQRRTCPRCKHESKSEPIAQTGWRKCLRCSKFFQVVPDDFNQHCQARIQRSSSLRHGTPKDGPKQHSDDDGVEHFRRIECFLCEDISVLSCPLNWNPDTPGFQDSVHYFWYKKPLPYPLPII